MSNRLKDASSPYLLQHADNPVDWYPWGNEALERARQEEKPIFLSIGYAACHWCHVMAHESFEDPETASLMNAEFINIKVDREERPDLDAIYMSAVQALSGQGGWPLSVFLTPQGEPYYGGTYFPPQRRHNLPSFRDVLRSLAHAWKEDRPRILQAANQLTRHVAAAPSLLSETATLDPLVLQQANETIFQHYDWTHGGWGSAPKFPQATTIEFLLRQRKNGLARDMALHALRKMAAGGIYDQIGGGFARYAVDEAWQVPHFEKMLYDNALLLKACIHAWRVTGDKELRRVAEATIGFLLREMRHPQGGFFSSLDADSEGEEGKFYVWKPAEIQSVLEEDRLFEIIRLTYGISAEGNFEGANILHRSLAPEDVARQLGITLEDVEQALEKGSLRLREARAQRIRPGLDDKVLTAWNGFALSALAAAARYLPQSDVLQAAQELADFLLGSLLVDGRLRRSWRQGVAYFNAYLEDHAALGIGLLDLYQVDFDPRWYQAALTQGDEILAHFKDPQGGFFDTRDDHETLIARPKSLQDSPTPSGNALAVDLLLRLGALEGASRFFDPAEQALSAMQATALQYPTSFSGWLCAMDFALGPQLQLAVAGDPASTAFVALQQVASQDYYPNLVLAGGQPGQAALPQLIQSRSLLDQQPTAYLCRNFACNLPTTSSQGLAAQLKEAMHAPKQN